MNKYCFLLLMVTFSMHPVFSMVSDDDVLDAEVAGISTGRGRGNFSPGGRGASSPRGRGGHSSDSGLSRGRGGHSSGNRSSRMRRTPQFNSDTYQAALAEGQGEEYLRTVQRFQGSPILNVSRQKVPYAPSCDNETLGRLNDLIAAVSQYKLNEQSVRKAIAANLICINDQMKKALFLFRLLVHAIRAGDLPLFKAALNNAHDTQRLLTWYTNSGTTLLHEAAMQASQEQSQVRICMVSSLLQKASESNDVMDQMLAETVLRGLYKGKTARGIIGSAVDQQAYGLQPHLMELLRVLSPTSRPYSSLRSPIQKSPHHQIKFE